MCVDIVEASSMDTVREAIEDHPEADQILLDLHMPGSRGFTSLLYVRSKHPTIPVVIVSATEDTTIVQRAIDFGASGFIRKSSSIETINDAVRVVLDGGISAPPLPDTMAPSEVRDCETARRLSTLTPHQLNVLFLLAEGHSNGEIATQLAVVEATVKAHITPILRKLRVRSRMQAAILAQRLVHTGRARSVHNVDELE